MALLPTHLERAREQAASRSSEPADQRRVDGLRRALLQVMDEQAPLLAKLLADGKVDPDEQGTLEEAGGRVARYYGLALTMECSDDEVRAALDSLIAAMEEHSRALTLASRGDREGAKAAWEDAKRGLGAVPPSTQPGDPSPIHAEAEVVYDRATGRSKYDADSEGWLAFGLRCPSSACREVRPYRMLSRHPTHRFACSVCRTPFLVFLATVVRAEREHRHSAATHLILTKGADGAEHSVTFDYMLEDGPNFEIAPGDLVLLTYDAAGRLRLVRDYTRGGEVLVHSNGRCFVATAAAGPHAPEVVGLRRYRDEVLLQRAWGRVLVALYERIGPPMAVLVARSDRSRRAARRLVRLAARLLPVER